MANRHFAIEITADALTVSTSESAHTNARRPSVNIAIMAASVGFFLWLCFHHDRYGYSLWRYLVRYRAGSQTFNENLFAVLMLGMVCGLMFTVSLRAFFPSGETVHCDRSRLTISKIPFISFRGKWQTRWLPTSEVKGLHFAVLQSGKGDSIYGIRFHTVASKDKMLAGVTAPQAYKIIGALKKLGAEAPHQRDMRYEVREALRDERERL
jgi:hypothetical protein